MFKKEIIPSIKFVVQPNKPKKNGRFTILCRITIQRKMAHINTQLDTTLEDWEASGQWPKSRKDKSRLVQMQADLERLASKMQSQGLHLTAKSLKDSFEHGGASGQGLLAYVDDFLKRREAQGLQSDGTLTNYKSKLRISATS